MILGHLPFHVADLQAVKIVDDALRMRGSAEDRALIVFQHAQATYFDRSALAGSLFLSGKLKTLIRACPLRFSLMAAADGRKLEMLSDNLNYRIFLFALMPFSAQ